jgi:hypothetical protein
MVSGVPFTVAVVVLMRVPELLTVGVVPPLPYPLPYLPPLLVEAVVAVGAGVEPLVVVPQAASRTRLTNASRVNQTRLGTFDERRWCFIACSFFQS